MKHINPRIQVEYLFGQNVAFQFLDGYLVDGTASGDTSFSASCLSDGSWTLSDCRPIICGSFSSLANDFTSPTSASFDGVVGRTWSRRPEELNFQTHLFLIL